MTSPTAKEKPCQREKRKNEEKRKIKLSTSFQLKKRLLRKTLAKKKDPIQTDWKGKKRQRGKRTTIRKFRWNWYFAFSQIRRRGKTTS